MKIIVANTYEYNLDQSLNSDERLEYINNLLNTYIELDDLHITIQDYFRDTWDKQNTKVCLDIIGYYLSKGSEEKQKHDNEVLSRKKDKDMNKWNDKYIVFSDLSKENKLKLGLIDVKDEVEE